MSPRQLRDRFLISLRGGWQPVMRVPTAAVTDSADRVNDQIRMLKSLFVQGTGAKNVFIG